MDRRLNQINPFSKRDSHSREAVITYKVLTGLSWILSILVSVFYAIHVPQDGRWVSHRGNIGGINWGYPSGFTLNTVIAYIYWIVLFVLQGGYIWHLFSSNLDNVNAACAVGSHFILNNLLHFAFVMLFVRAEFGWAELILLVNFVNLSSLYFRHNKYPRFIHTPTVSGPLAWTFVAIYWNGAIMVPHQNSLVARIFANIFIWAILVYGAFFVVTYKDYTMGFSLSVLSASLGVAQFERQIIAFQWIFAFVIMAVLFVGTVAIAVPTWMGKDVHSWGRRRDEPPPQDAERAPLLGES